MGTHVFLQAFDFVINCLNKNKFLLPYYGTSKLSDGIRFFRGMPSIVYMLQTIHYFLLICYYILTDVHYIMYP